MTSTNVKAMVVKMFTAGFLVAAVVVAAPTRAEAQWSVGVRVGNAPSYGQAYGRPVVVAPAYGYYGQTYYGQPSYGRGYDEDRDYDHERREMYLRHEREERYERERFEHSRDWDRSRGRYDRDDYRDYRDHDRH